MMSRGTSSRTLALLLFAALVVGSGLATPAFGQGREEGAKKVENSESGLTSPGRGRTVGHPFHGGTRVVPLGSGRGRLRLILDALEPLPASEDDRVFLAAEGFLLAFLRRELPERFPGVLAVETIERIESRNAESGRVTLRERLLEIRGEIKSLEPAAEFTERLLALRSTDLTASFYVFSLPSDGSPLGEARVSLLDSKAFGRRLAEARDAAGSMEHETITINAGSGEDARRSRLRPHRYIRKQIVEDVMGESVVVPEIATAYDGIQARFTGILMPQGRILATASQVGVGVLAEPIATKREAVGDGTEPRIVHEPRINAVQWASERIKLDADDVGYVVDRLVYPGVVEAEGSAVRELVILCRIEIESLPPHSLAGVVLGYDDKLRVAFVRSLDGSDSQPGQGLTFSRNGKSVGRGEVVEVIGGIMTIAVRSGRVRRGDEVR